MKGIESDLATLDQLLRKLEHEYDQFFSGLVRAEPLRTDGEVQKLIKEHTNRSIQNPSLRFRFMNLVARYNSFKKVWTRKVREMEEGRTFGRPMRAGTPPPAARRATAPAAIRKEFRVDSLRGEKSNVGDIFEAYKQLRQESGEPTQRLRLESFTRILDEKVSKMKESRKCQTVEVHLRRDKNKTRIVVRPVREKV